MKKNGSRKVVMKVGFISIWGLHTKKKKGRCIILRSTFCVCVSEFSQDIIDG